MKKSLIVLALFVLLVPGFVYAQCQLDGNVAIRYGWVCGDYGPCACNIPGWNPPGTGAPCTTAHYYANGYDTVDAYAGLQLAMDIMVANYGPAAETLCTRIYGYPVGCLISYAADIAAIN